MKLQLVETAVTDQMAPMRADQVRNNAGGFVFEVQKWQRLERFLILGTEGNTYYQSEKTLTYENLSNVLACLEEDGPRVVEMAREISADNRTTNNDYPIFVLALALAEGNPATRYAVKQAAPWVLRIATHLFHFAAYTKAITQGTFRKNSFGKVVRAWYERNTLPYQSYQMIKYRQRDGWTHQDLLRIAHPAPKTEEESALFAWAARGEVEPGLPRLVQAHLTAMELPEEAEERLLQLIQEETLPWEALPTWSLNNGNVWRVMLDNGVPITALVRQLPRLTRLGVLQGEYRDMVAERIQDEELLEHGRVHPIKMLAALVTYRSGGSAFHKREHVPVPMIIDALEAGFYNAFRAVEPTGLRYVLGLDVSGSMRSGMVGGIYGLQPALATAALAMTYVRSEPEVTCMAFTSSPSQLPFSARLRLDAALDMVQQRYFGATDCALPMIWAQENDIQADVFVILTDNETWAGRVHPYQALREYRNFMGIDAKLAVVGMTSTGFSIADPNDAGMMDFVGFDTGMPTAINAFAKEEQE